MWYSQHLDWHFRQNRRGKKNARVANSRKWYYSLSDWKNYEELEDLEERGMCTPNYPTFRFVINILFQRKTTLTSNSSNKPK